MPSKQLVEKNKELEAKQVVLAKVYELAGPDMDLSKVKRIGEVDVSQLSTVQKVEEMRTLDKELNDIYDECRALADAEKGKSNLDRINGDKGMKHPDPNKAGDPEKKEIKTLGEMVTEAKEYEGWVKNAKAGDYVAQFDLYPSDFLLSKHPDALKQYIKTLMTTTAGWAPESIRMPGFVEATARPVQVLDIIPMGRTGFEKIVFMEETTRTHSAAETAEAATFKESTFAFTEKESSVRKITDSLPVTDEQLEDVLQIGGYINGRLTFGLRQRLDNQVINGDGVAPNLRGILNVTGINTQAKGTDPTPDAFHKAMRTIRVTGRAMPTHHVMHPQDWESIRLLRTADGVYIWGNPSEAGPERMWGLPVVQGDVIAQGTGLVGSFVSAWISLFERRGVDLQVGFTGSQFVEGKKTIRADMRFAFVVFRPSAFSQVTGL